MKINVLIVDDARTQFNYLKRRVIKECKKYPLFEISDKSFTHLRTKDEITAKNIVELLARPNNICHLAIVDFQLEIDGLNGVDVTEIINRSNERYKTKVIFYSAKDPSIDVISNAMANGAFSFVGKDAIKKGTNVKIVSLEINRALFDIARDMYVSYLTNVNNINLPEFLTQPGVFNELEEGAPCYKVLFLSDLANSTVFFNWIKNQAHTGPGVLNEIIPDLLGWQTEIIKDVNGIIDKYYGDEVRAYFGKEINKKINNPEAPKDAEKALTAAIRIIREFGTKLLEWKGKVTLDEKVLPKKIPYPRIILHYNQVVWGMFGNTTYRDFSIWTMEVAVLNRVLKYIREINPCKTEYSDIKDNIVGDIFVTGDFLALIDEKDKFCFHETKTFDNEKTVSIYSYKFNDSDRCKLCLEHRK